MGERGLESVKFLDYGSKFKIKKSFFFSFFWGGGLGVGGGVGGLGRSGDVGRISGWTDEQAQTNLPLPLLRSWDITMH